MASAYEGLEHRLAAAAARVGPGPLMEWQLSRLHETRAVPVGVRTVAGVRIRYVESQGAGGAERSTRQSVDFTARSRSGGMILAGHESLMKTIVIGTSTIGNAITALFRDSGHDVIQVGRTSGDAQADLTDISSPRSLFAQQVPFTAVANAAGEVFRAPLGDTDDQQWARSIGSKGMGQINLVRAGLPYISDRGSFTLVSGIVGAETINAMTIGATVNRMVEGFVQAAATELPRGVRINCLSPAVLAESAADLPSFPGFTPVPAHDVALAYLRAASNPYNGRILTLHPTH